MNDSQLYVNAKDTEGKTLLHHAAANNAHQEAALLLRHNADVSARDENGYPPPARSCGKRFR